MSVATFVSVGWTERGHVTGGMCSALRVTLHVVSPDGATITGAVAASSASSQASDPGSIRAPGPTGTSQTKPALAPCTVICAQRVVRVALVATAMREVEMKAVSPALPTTAPIARAFTGIETLNATASAKNRE
jgi:hypothetical protein